jgi:hypothetical protein
MGLLYLFTVKVRFILEDAIKALRGTRGTALTFFLPQHLMRWVVKSAQRPLYSRIEFLY